MLIRVFRGRIREGAYDALLRALHDKDLPRLRANPDVLSVSVGLPWEGSRDEYLLETHWTSTEALAAYCEDWRTPRIEGYEENLLVSVAAHHFVAAAPPTLAPATLTPGSPVASLEGVAIDAARQLVAWNGSSVHLSPREMSAMLALATDPEVPISSVELARRIWPGSCFVSAYDVRRVIHQLRCHLGSGGIPIAVRNLRGLGYFLESAPLD